MNLAQILSLLFLFIISSVPAFAEDAQSVRDWNDFAAAVASERSMAFTQESFDHTVSDSVYAMAVFEDGKVFMFSLFHYETLLFDSWGVYMLIAEPGGTTHWKTERLSKKKLLVSEERLSVTHDSNLVEGGGTTYRIRWSIEGLGVDLRYDNFVAPWMPGDGTHRLSEDGSVFQRRSVFSPRAEVTGTIIVDGALQEIRGEGMASKTIIVNRLNRFNPELLSMRVFGVASDVYGTEIHPFRLHIGLLDSTAHRTYNSKKLSRLFVTEHGKWLFATPEYELDYLETTRSEDPPYSYPSRFSLNAKALGYTLSGEYHVLELFDITDIMDELPSWLRPIVLVFVNRPVYFRCFGLFTGSLTYPDGSVEDLVLYGPYEYVVVR